MFIFFFNFLMDPQCNKRENGLKSRYLPVYFTYFPLETGSRALNPGLYRSLHSLLYINIALYRSFHSLYFFYPNLFLSPNNKKPGCGSVCTYIMNERSLSSIAHLILIFLSPNNKKPGCGADACHMRAYVKDVGPILK